MATQFNRLANYPEKFVWSFGPQFALLLFFFFFFGFVGLAILITGIVLVCRFGIAALSALIIGSTWTTLGFLLPCCIGIGVKIEMDPVTDRFTLIREAPSCRCLFCGCRKVLAMRKLSELVSADIVEQLDLNGASYRIEFKWSNGDVTPLPRWIRAHYFPHMAVQKMQTWIQQYNAQHHPERQQIVQQLPTPFGLGGPNYYSVIAQQQQQITALQAQLAHNQPYPVSGYQGVVPGGVVMVPQGQIVVPQYLAPASYANPPATANTKDAKDSAPLLNPPPYSNPPTL